MKQIIYVVLFLTLIIGCSAKTSTDYLAEIKTESYKVHIFFPTDMNISEEEKVYVDLETYILENITYKFTHYPKDLKTIWKTKTGDCSDRATLLKQMLLYRNIKSKIVHGVCDKVRHDDLIIYLPDRIIDRAKYICDDWKIYGNGYW